jgi:FkbM family methyltransferase
MRSAIKRLVRPVVLPCLHGWQWLNDYSRRKLRDHRFRHRILGGGTIILQDVHGIRFVLYPFDRPNWQNLVQRTCDVAEFQVIPRLLESGATAIDIGANAGLYSVLLSRLCGPTGRVWAFEPVVDTYWRLRETLALNRCENVVPVQSAVCDRSGSVTMNLFEPQFAEWNSLGVRSARDGKGKLVSSCRSVEVSAYTLDEFCERQGIRHINFLKVDVEGFELSVFKGAERLLSERRIDYICFEISLEPLKAVGVESRKVFEALEEHDYRAYRFDRKTGRFLGPVRDCLDVWTNFFASWKDLSNLNEVTCDTEDDQWIRQNSTVGNPE